MVAIKGLKNSDLCDAGAVLHQLSCQAKWELIVMWFYDKPVDDGYMQVLFWDICKGYSKAK